MASVGSLERCRPHGRAMSQAEKRILMELERWQREQQLRQLWEADAATAAYATEHPHWTVEPAAAAAGAGGGAAAAEPPAARAEAEADSRPRSDPLRWRVALRPCRGPFQGGELVWEMQFPADYPFKMPLLDALHYCGMAVPFDSVCAGQQVTLTPMGCTGGERYAASVVGVEKDPDRVILCWSDTGEGVPPAGPAGEQALPRAWWDAGARPVLAGSRLFHPFLGPSGYLCQCGMKNEWSPSWHFAQLLAFTRVAVEDARTAQTKCFCAMNLEAAEAYKRNAEGWAHAARAMFLGGTTAPLCLSAAGAAREEADSVEVRCTTLAGERVAALRLSPACTAPELRKAVAERVPVPERVVSWRPVLPDGRCLDESDPDATLAELFGLNGGEKAA